MPSFKRILIFTLLLVFHIGCIALIILSSLHHHFKIILFILQGYILLSYAHVFLPVLIFLFRLKSIKRLYKVSQENQLSPHTDFLILVPAHNEEPVLPALLSSIQNQTYPAQKIKTVVIADNCIDKTAALSQQMGAKVLERFTGHPSNKAKALVFAADRLRLANELQNQVICIIDADCQLDPIYLSELNNIYAKPGAVSVIQSHRSVHNIFHSKVTILDAAAEALRQVVVSASRKTLGMENFIYGLGCSMRGFVFNELMVETKDSLVEDKVWKVYFSRKKIAVDYCPTAQLRYEVVHSNKDFQKQRKRWIAGHMEILRKYGFSMLWQSIKRGSFSQFDFAWELLQPPRSFLLILTFIFGLSALWDNQISLLPFWCWFLLTGSFFLYGALGMWLINARPAHYMHLFSGLDMILGIFKTTFMSLMGKTLDGWDATRKRNKKVETVIGDPLPHESYKAG